MELHISGKTADQVRMLVLPSAGSSHPESTGANSFESLVREQCTGLREALLEGVKEVYRERGQEDGLVLSPELKIEINWSQINPTKLLQLEKLQAAKVPFAVTLRAREDSEELKLSLSGNRDGQPLEITAWSGDLGICPAEPAPYKRTLVMQDYAYQLVKHLNQWVSLFPGELHTEHGKTVYPVFAVQENSDWAKLFWPRKDLAWGIHCCKAEERLEPNLNALYAPESGAPSAEYLYPSVKIPDGNLDFRLIQVLSPHRPSRQRLNPKDLGLKEFPKSKDGYAFDDWLLLEQSRLLVVELKSSVFGKGLLGSARSHKPAVSRSWQNLTMQVESMAKERLIGSQQDLPPEQLAKLGIRSTADVQEALQAQAKAGKALRELLTALDSTDVGEQEKRGFVRLLRDSLQLVRQGQSATAKAKLAELEQDAAFPAQLSRGLSEVLSSI